MHHLRWLSGGPFRQPPPGTRNRDSRMDTAGYPKKKRYHTGPTSAVPVVLFYTDQKKEKKQIGVWPCLLALLEILFFLVKAGVVKEIHIFIFVIQPQLIFFPFGCFFATGCRFFGLGTRDIEFIEIGIPFFIFLHLIPFIYFVFAFNVFFVFVILIRLLFSFGCGCLGAFFCGGFRS